jgi:hypothetical protein
MESTARDRQAAGAQALGALMTYWLSRGGMAHEDLAEICDWGMGERCTLHGAALSRIRNGSQPRGAGLQHLDAMAQGNEAIWTWQTRGEKAAIQQYGPFSGWGVEQETLDRTIWLPRPDDEREPLDLGDLAMVVAGRMVLPYLHAGISSPGQAALMNDGLLAVLDQIAMEREWSPRRALREFAAAYPGGDTARNHRLKLLVMGEVTLNADELEGELAALAEMIRVVRGVEVFTPADLREELLLSGGRQGS